MNRQLISKDADAGIIPKRQERNSRPELEAKWVVHMGRLPGRQCLRQTQGDGVGFLPLKLHITDGYIRIRGMVSKAGFQANGKSLEARLILVDSRFDAAPMTSS